MLSRLRFLSCSSLSRRDLRAISNALSKREYSHEVVWGFIDVHNEGDAVTGTFVERFESEEQVEDPFGISTTYKRIHFNQTSFRLGLESPELEIYDGPRSIAPLLTELSNAVGSNLSFGQISVDLHALMKHLKSQTFSFALISANLQDATLTPDVFARVAVFGNGEIGPYLKLAAFGKKVVFEKISILGTLRMGAFKMELSSDGRVSIHNGPVEDLMKLVRASVGHVLSEI